MTWPAKVPEMWALRNHPDFPTVTSTSGRLVCISGRVFIEEEWTPITIHNSDTVETLDIIEPLIEKARAHWGHADGDAQYWWHQAWRCHLMGLPEPRLPDWRAELRKKEVMRALACLITGKKWKPLKKRRR